MTKELVKVYEVTGAGFFGGTDATDDRVLWVTGDSQEAVMSAIKDTGATFHGAIDEVYGAIPDYDINKKDDLLLLRQKLQFFANNLPVHEDTLERD